MLVNSRTSAKFPLYCFNSSHLERKLIMFNKILQNVILKVIPKHNRIKLTLSLI